MARKTRTDRSLLLIMLIIPVRKADTAETPASSPGIPRVRLLKNVSPPRCPDATSIPNTAENKRNAIISPVDHLPTVVLVLRLILMLFIIIRDTIWHLSILATKRYIF